MQARPPACLVPTATLSKICRHGSRRLKLVGPCLAATATPPKIGRHGKMPAQARRPLYLLKLMLVAPIDLAATFTPSKI
jgi:hypothetical protein